MKGCQERAEKGDEMNYLEKGDYEIHWGFGNVPSPGWWEAYVLHARFDVGISFDILTWKFGIDLGFRYREFGVNIGPISIWFNRP